MKERNVNLILWSDYTFDSYTHLVAKVACNMPQEFCLFYRIYHVISVGFKFRCCFLWVDRSGRKIYPRKNLKPVVRLFLGLRKHDNFSHENSQQKKLTTKITCYTVHRNGIAE